MASAAAKGAALLDKGKFTEAIEQYTLALVSSPESPDYYIKRSISNTRKTPADLDAALRDAEIAVVATTKRARRELILQAQLRRGIALFGLERYADAGFVFGVVKGMDKEEKTLGIWEGKVKSKLGALEEGDQRGVVSVEKVPNIKIPVPEVESEETAKKEEIEKKDEAVIQGDKPTPMHRMAEPTPPSKIKHEWYQSGEKVYFTLLAKGVPKDKATIDIQPQSVSCGISSIEHSADYKSDIYLLSFSNRIRLRILHRSSFEPHRPIQIHLQHHAHQSRNNLNQSHPHQMGQTRRRSNHLARNLQTQRPHQSCHPTRRLQTILPHVLQDRPQKLGQSRRRHRR